MLAVQSEAACSVATSTVDISRELQAVVQPVLYMNPNLMVAANSFSEGLHQLLNHILSNLRAMSCSTSLITQLSFERTESFQ